VDELIVVVDEAHNLPDYARELSSSVLSLRQLSLALREAREFDLPPLSDGLPIRDLIELLGTSMVEMAREYLMDVDGLVPAGELETRLMSGLGLTSHGIRRLARDLVNDGEVVREKRRKQGRLPRSHLRSLGIFLEFWMDMESERYVQLVLGKRSAERRGLLLSLSDVRMELDSDVDDPGRSMDYDGRMPGVRLPELAGPRGCSPAHHRAVEDAFGGGFLSGGLFIPPMSEEDRHGRPGVRVAPTKPFDQGSARGKDARLLALLDRWERATGARLEAFCLDPSITAAPLLDSAAALHMSGTLRPLAEYRDTMGLPGSTRLLQLPSPFPPENRQVLYATDVTTRYEVMERVPDMPERLSAHLEVLLNGSMRNTLVLFPSFELLERFAGGGLLAGIRRVKLFDERGMSQRELMALVEEFRATRGAAMFSVAGGRLSEGMDYPDEDLELVVMVGIPYPPPTARQRALSHFYDVRFGKGWEYTVTAPTLRKLLQGVGRLIRRPDDRGIAVILDKRARHFADDIPDLLQSWDPAGDVVAFFG
jgi:Rad3-related DNA helicase